MLRGGRRSSLPVLKGRGIDAAAEPREPLPPGWIRVESRSKPGTFYYAHPATKRTQMERPVDARHAPRAAPSGPIMPVPEPKRPERPEPVPVEDEETAEEKREKEEARRAEQKAREEEEEKERQEVLLRARAKRAQQMLEEERRRKEEEEQEEEERRKAAERRREKKVEEKRREEERQRQTEIDLVDKALDQAASPAVAVGRRGDGSRHSGAKWKKEAEKEDEEEVTQEDLEKWKAAEEQRERDEVEAKRRKIEEEARRKREAEEEERRKREEFAAAVERAKRMKREAHDREKQEELRKEAERPERAREVAQPDPAMAAQARDIPSVSIPPQPQQSQFMQPQSMPFFQPMPPAPPPPPPKLLPTPPTLANLLSGAVAKPDFGSLLKHGNEELAPAAAPDSGPQSGTILWFNGRRKCGLLLADDGRQLRIPIRAANTGNLAPPVAGLMHGTRVTYILDHSLPDSPVCNIRPLHGQSGLSCGGDSQKGARMANEDRTIATDLQDSLGHMVGIFDGHRGTFCADYLSQEVPKMIVQGVRDAFGQLPPGVSLETLGDAEEVERIKSGIVAGLQATDRSFLALAQHHGFKDGASALIAIVM
ncbi:unnamed protein product, partial [Effrenium voratum]